MKKMFTLAMTLLSFSFLFAQRNKPYDDNTNASVYDNRVYTNDGINRRPDHAVEMQSGDERRDDQARINQEGSRNEWEGTYRKDDRHRDDYHNDRHIGSWERDRADDRIKRDRADKLKAFGGGVLLGGVLGVLIGTQR